MTEIFSELNYWMLLLLFLLGMGAFIISTVSGGGGSLVLVPILNWAIGVTSTAPVLNLGTFLGRPSRLIIFWNHIHWKVCIYYAVSAITGAWLGSWLFESFKAEWLQVFVGLFLISTIFQYRFGKKKQSFAMKLWYFIPLGLVLSVFSTIVGGVGPVLNPFYMNLGLDREELIATKTANSFFMGISQIGSYSFLGLLHDQLWIYGIALGLGATVGNIIGKKLLADMKSVTFRKLVISIMVISGVLLIISHL